jgi:hypothetical protein
LKANAQSGENEHRFKERRGRLIIAGVGGCCQWQGNGDFRGVVYRR